MQKKAIMLIAKEKAKSNIGEYLIYMFQVEDLIRACEFDMEIINERIVNQYDVDQATKKEIYNWYAGLNDLMIEENLKKEGHLSFLENKINELFDFHLYLISKSDEQDYISEFNNLGTLLEEVRSKQGNCTNDIKAIINLIYGVYLLRLKMKEVSKETLLAVKQLSGLLALLSKKFKAYESGELKID